MCLCTVLGRRVRNLRGNRPGADFRRLRASAGVAKGVVHGRRATNTAVNGASPSLTRQGTGLGRIHCLIIINNNENGSAS